MSGIGVILNPYSRSYRRDPERLKRVGFIVGDKGSCHTTDTLEQVHELAQEFKERDIDILGMSGGDGTIHKTLTAFINVYGEKPLPRIALLRGGTMNTIAGQLGIHGTPEYLLSNLILKYHEGEAFEETKVHVLKVNGDHGFLLGLGLPSRFVETYHKGGGYTPARAAWLLFRAMCSALFATRFSQKLNERFDCKLSIDGRPAPFKNYTTIVMGTVPSVGFNFRTLYRARSQTGQFQVVAISGTARQTLLTFPRMVLAQPTKSEHVIDEMASTVVMEFEQPVSYMLDGDFPERPPRRIEVATGPLLTCIIS
jgi:diacylglycerol kinase (ATP)